MIQNTSSFEAEITDKDEIYQCKYCGTDIPWNGGDDRKGTIWGCEGDSCGVDFCRQCFIDRFGIQSFLDMVNKEDKILCPNCHAEEHNPKS